MYKMATIFSDNTGIEQAAMALRKALHVSWIAYFLVQETNSEMKISMSHNMHP